MPFNSNTYGINVCQEFQSGLANADWNGSIPSTYIANQVNELYALGIRRVRVAAPGLTPFGISSVIPAQQEYMTRCAEKGMSIQWGTPTYGNKISSWNYWYSNVLPYIQWLQNLKNTYGNECQWIMGNEQEASWSFQTEVVTVTRVSNIVTVDCGFVHSLQPGFTLVIYSNPLFSNVTATVQTVPTPTTFTFTLNGADGSAQATISPRPQTTFAHITYQAAQFRALTDPVIDMDLVYSCSHGKYGPDYYFTLFKNFGLGNITRVNLNVYGEGTTGSAILTSFKAHVDRLVTDFGTNCDITEYGLFPDDENDAVVPRTESSYLPLWRERNLYIQQKGLKQYLFAFKMPEGSQRLHLAMTKPDRYTIGTEYQPFFSEWLDRSVDSKMIMGWNDAINQFNFSLIDLDLFTDTMTIRGDGLLKLPGKVVSSGGAARNLASGYNFTKTGQYTWAGWLKMRDMNAQLVNTIIRVGTPYVGGYRILIERANGIDYIKFQDYKTFSTQTMTIPSGVNVHNWFHFAIAWRGATSTWEKYFYINGRLITVATANINYSLVTAINNFPIYLGTDDPNETLDGYLSDVSYWEVMAQPDDIWDLLKNRESGRALSYWQLDEKTGNIAYEFVGGKLLNLIGEAKLINLSGTRSRWMRKLSRGEWYSPVNAA